jgi:type I restriction-modification system DNA methylase subunit
MPTYHCAICVKVSKQKKHHETHITSKGHIKAKRIFELELGQLSKEELIAKYKSNLITHILATQETVIVDNDDVSSVSSDGDIANEIIEDDALTISNKEALREHIHKIHNYLRNNGAGYGMNALKVFNLLYGLKKLEDSKLFDKIGLNPTCKFSLLLKLAHENDGERINEHIVTEILNGLYESDFKHLLFYEIPRNIYAKMYPQLIKEIERISLIEQSCREHLSGKIYEYFIGRDETAISELGAYFTNRHIVNYIMGKLSPQVEEDGTIHDMIDMFAGSGGFTTGYINYLNEHGKVNWTTETNKIYHFDMNEDVIKSAGLEIMCLTGQVPDMKNNLVYKNSFTDPFDNKKFHYVLTNPPYGGDKTNKSEEIMKLEKIRDHIKALLPTIADEDVRVRREKQFKEIERKIKKNKKEVDESKVSLDKCSDRIKHFAKKYGLKSNDKEGCSLILMMDMVAPNGTVIGVLKEGVFFNKTYKDVRKCLIENFNVREVISVPSDQFENTSTKTSIIIFDNTEEKTSEVKFSELIINTVQEDTFDEINGQIVLTANKGDIIDVEDALISQATKDEILENAICSLNGKDYNKREIVCGEGYEMVRLGDMCKCLSTTKHCTNIGNPEGKYRFYNSSQDSKLYVDFCEVNEYSIILGQGGNFNIHLDKNFTASKHVCVIQLNKLNNILLQFIYYIIPELQKTFITNGSTISWLNKTNICNFKIPIPKSKAKIQEWVDRISAPYNEKNEKQLRIKELELFVQHRIKDIGENEECDEVELGSVCEYIKTGKNKTPDNKEGTLYPYYGTADITGYTDHYLFDGTHILVARNGTMGNCFLVNGKIFPSDHIFVIKNNKQINILTLYYLIKSISKEIQHNSNGSLIKGISKENLSSIKFRIPKNKKLIDELEPTFQQIEQLQHEVKMADELFTQYIKQLSEEALPPSP